MFCSFSAQRMVFGLACLILVHMPAHARQAVWPRLDGEHQAECTQALQLARRAYGSRSPNVYAPQPLPKNFPSVAVLGPDGVELSAGDAIVADPDTFDKLRIEQGYPGSTYWQNNPAHGYRLAVIETRHGWRGDNYTLVTVDAGVSAQAVSAQHEKGTLPAAALMMNETGWRPPFIYRRQDGALWVVTVGHVAIFLANWKVYVPGQSGFRHACTIRFRPGVERAIELLPQPVRKLEAMLDRSLRRENSIEDGTLQPARRLRIEVEHAWANAAMRPWAYLSAYNTRAEVERGLQQWAMYSRANSRNLKLIRRHYAPAQLALANYYRTRFGIAAGAAQRQARYILDRMLRSHYYFHNPERLGSDDERDRNPWPGH